MRRTVVSVVLGTQPCASWKYLGAKKCAAFSAKFSRKITLAMAKNRPGYMRKRSATGRSAARSPDCPARKLDCASCHDPHAPMCLGCLGKTELRAWCKGCHAQP